MSNQGDRREFSSTPPRGWLRRARRHPGVHFLLLGILLFALDRSRSGGVDSSDVLEIVVTPSQVERLGEEWQRAHGRAPTDEEEAELIADLVDEELLVEEAFRLGLDRNDLVIRRRLSGKMRLLEDDPSLPEDGLYRRAVELGLDRDDAIVRRRLALKIRLLAVSGAGPVRPSEEQIRDHYEKHLDRFQKPPRVHFSHLFLRRDGRGEAEARRLLAELESRGAGDQAIFDRGDPFPLGSTFPSRAVDQLEQSFGAAFGSRLLELEPGVWRGPVESAYGWHLVWVHDTKPGRPAELAEVREQILRELAEEQREERLRAILRALRSRYKIRVESSPTSIAENRQGYPS